MSFLTLILISISPIAHALFSLLAPISICLLLIPLHTFPLLFFYFTQISFFFLWTSSSSRFAIPFMLTVATHAPHSLRFCPRTFEFSIVFIVQISLSYFLAFFLLLNIAFLNNLSFNYTFSLRNTLQFSYLHIDVLFKSVLIWPPLVILWFRCIYDV